MRRKWEELMISMRVVVGLGGGIGKLCIGSIVNIFDVWFCKVVIMFGFRFEYTGIF